MQLLWRRCLLLCIGLQVVDGNDVEFVLGCKKDDTDNNNNRGVGEDVWKIGMWLVDFNMCQSINQHDHEEGILKQLVDGFWFNDPYYPRPGGQTVLEKRLWDVFVERYLGVSGQLTDCDMPQRLVEELRREGGKKHVQRLL